MINIEDSEGGHDDNVTLTLDRRLAEDLYYALALALGSRDFGLERVLASGKNGGKGHQSN